MTINTLSAIVLATLFAAGCDAADMPSEVVLTTAGPAECVRVIVDDGCVDFSPRDGVYCGTCAIALPGESALLYAPSGSERIDVTRRAVAEDGSCSLGCPAAH